jgi:hypothetical protein
LLFLHNSSQWTVILCVPTSTLFCITFNFAAVVVVIVVRPSCCNLIICILCVCSLVFFIFFFKVKTYVRIYIRHDDKFAYFIEIVAWFNQHLNDMAIIWQVKCIFYNFFRQSMNLLNFISKHKRFVLDTFLASSNTSLNVLLPHREVKRFGNFFLATDETAFFSWKLCFLAGHKIFQPKITET